MYYLDLTVQDTPSIKFLGLFFFFLKKLIKVSILKLRKNVGKSKASCQSVCPAVLLGLAVSIWAPYRKPLQESIWNRPDMWNACCVPGAMLGSFACVTSQSRYYYHPVRRLGLKCLRLQEIMFKGDSARGRWKLCLPWWNRRRLSVHRGMNNSFIEIQLIGYRTQSTRAKCMIIGPCVLGIYDTISIVIIRTFLSFSHKPWWSNSPHSLFPMVTLS